VFGPAGEATMLAEELKIGSVVINDLLVPTADPRLPFGGRGNSGFGVTRGTEGLLAMTVPKVISRRTGRFAPHLGKQPATRAQDLLGALQLLHAGSLGQRLRGLRQMVAARGKSNSRNAPTDKISTETESSS
jgi:aldehyde dehydrogenase (NAD+)